MDKKLLEITIFFGGNSERGVSINSARAVFEILKKKAKIRLYYVNKFFQIFKVDNRNIYSNTAEDFFFKVNPEKNFWENFQTDFAICLIHGILGEDGQLIGKLEKKNIPHLFSSSEVCKQLYNKKTFTEKLWKKGFNSWDCVTNTGDTIGDIIAIHSRHQKVIIKPTEGGSSLNVSISDSLSKTIEILKSYEQEMIIEEVHQGKEFSIAVVNGVAQNVVEIEKKQEIYSYKNKYFPDNQTIIKVPCEFQEKTVQLIKQKAEEIWQIFGCKDAIRLDGWVLSNGIIFSECNPIGAMELNSLFFQSCNQSPFVVFLEMINTSLKRYNIKTLENDQRNKIVIPVLCGGDSLEQEVSFLSGCNVIAKLYNSDKYIGKPFILKNYEVFEIPEGTLFKHCLKDVFFSVQKSINPIKLEDFLERYKNQFIFLALHGGIGENGTIQKMLDEKNIKYNGSNSELSELCMDKFKTVNLVESKLGLFKVERNLINEELAKKISIKNSKIIKPNNDGCSNGVMKINTKEDLDNYMNALKTDQEFYNGVQMIRNQWLLLEDYIECDRLSFITTENSRDVKIHKKTGWIELTCGVMNGKPLPCSISVVEHDILTAEEKFQQGTGINLTPPPEFLIHKKQQIKINKFLENLCNLLSLNTYARIDFFFNRFTSDISLIEINTLPALTYSTVIFQQYLINNDNPEKLIEEIIEQSYA